MELRHLRYFIAVAEELHFARAAERLHIEQSPLSRAIKDLEYDLDVQLLERTTRSTRLTWAGQVFLDEAKRVLSAMDQAKASAKAAATGYRGTFCALRCLMALIPCGSPRYWPNAARKSRTSKLGSSKSPCPSS